MKTVALTLFVILVVLVAATALKGGDALGTAMRSTGEQLLRFAPIIIIAVAIAGFTDALLPEGFVERWLSDASGWRGIGIAWVAGALTPAGTIVGLPLVATLYKAGAGVSVLVTYMTSFALLSFIRMPLEAGFIGWRLTLIRVGASLVLPPIAGLLAKAFVSLSPA